MHMKAMGPASSEEIFYPESDGKPMADNTKQLDWIFMLVGNLRALYRDDPNVFVAGNQFWYPVKGHPEIVISPDAYVVFGRPKGHRPSWKQWEENDVPMTVVFEVLSPGNDWFEMADKQVFYEDHGVQEFYIYDPDYNRLSIFIRRGEVFRREREANKFVSPLLGICFDLSGSEMVVTYPDGRPFVSLEDLAAERANEEQLRRNAEQRADQAQQRAEQAERRTARLAELSRKARKGLATTAEVEELERLEDESAGA